MKRIARGTGVPAVAFESEGLSRQETASRTGCALQGRAPRRWCVSSSSLATRRQTVRGRGS